MNTTFPTKDWESWHDTMPGSPPTLHVTGKVICPTTGFSAILVPHYPPSLNQDIYLTGGFLLIYGVLLVLGNLIADIVLSMLDPRIRLN